MNIVEAMEAPEWFGPWFHGETWEPWKAVMKAAFALPMTGEDLAVFGDLAGGRAPPVKRVGELVIVAGRRSGKDSVASAICAFAAAIEQGHLGRLRPGELASVMCLACDRDQARIIKGYVASYFDSIPQLKAMVVGETKQGLELANGVETVIATNDFRAVRGRAVLIAVLDEVAFYASETSASPDIETDRALDPALATLPGAMKILISSPYRKGGLLFDKWRRYFGQDDDRVLVVQAETSKLNPSIDPAIIERAMADDPVAARAEWGAQFRDDVSGFLSAELVEAGIDPGVIVRPPRSGVRYVGYVDAASGAGKDSFTAAIAHREDDTMVLDALFEQRPQFNPQTTTGEVAALLKSYHLSTATGDKYSAGFLIEAFSQHGVAYRYCANDTSTNYLETLPLFTSGRVRLLDNPRLVAQFAGLERRTSVTGRDRVDHGQGDKHDDLAAACAGALVLASTVQPEMTFVAPIIVGVPGARIPHGYDRGSDPFRGGAFDDQGFDKRQHGFSVRQ